ncbi:MAG: PAS domain S-box protein [Candidatus Bathyarchaeota archaeon]|nr:PAS domain S-box protein [Candidatus Bathyarchaeota archaeon]
MSIIVFSLISLLSAIISLGLAFFVLHLNLSNRLNRIFFMTALLGFLYSFTTVIMWMSPDAYTALVWHKLGTLWPFFIALVLHFALVFTGSGWLKNKSRYLILYGPAAAFFLVDLFTTYINTAPTLEYWGFNDQAGGTWVCGVSTVWSAGLPLLAFALCFRYYRNAKEYTQRQRGKFVTIGLSIPIIAFIVTNMLARLLDIGVPNLGVFSTLFFSIFVGYAVAKYDLFTIDAALAAENLFATIPDPLILSDMNTNMIKVNERLTEFSGYNKDELIGEPISKLCGENQEQCNRLLDSLEMERIIRNREMQIRTKQGARRHALVSGSMVENKKGRPLGLTFVIHDITERKIAEEELATTKSYLETILNSMLSAIVIIDAESHMVIDLNNAALRMLGTQREEAVGKVCHNFLCPTEKGRCPITDLGLTMESQERTLTRANGEKIQILKNVVKLDSPIGLLLIENFIDITERKKIEQQLVKAQRLASIGELAGQLGHDLRNPLAGIKNGVYYVKKKGNSISAEQREEILKIIEVAVEDSNRIVTSLIDYSSELHLSLGETTPCYIVAKALAKLEVPQRITIQNQAADDTALRVDEAKIEDTVARIIQNAIHAIPEEGTIRILSRQEGASIKLSFTDSGIGIPQNVIPKLFTPLFTTKAKGMGMSLAICKRVVEAHGGAITVESTLGKGTTVVVSLPHKQQLQTELAAALIAV